MESSKGGSTVGLLLDTIGNALVYLLVVINGRKLCLNVWKTATRQIVGQEDQEVNHARRARSLTQNSQLVLLLSSLFTS